MDRSLRTWVAVFFTGFLMVLVPFYLEENSPSSGSYVIGLVQMFGLILLILSLIRLNTRVVQQWARIVSAIIPINLISFVLIYLIGLTGIAIAILIGTEWVFWVSAGLAAFVNSLFVYKAYENE